MADTPGIDRSLTLAAATGCPHVTSSRSFATHPLVASLSMILMVIDSFGPYQISIRTVSKMKNEQQTKKKKRVYYEDIKASHTTHWDLDYLSQAELEALYRKNRKAGSSGYRLLNRIHRMFKRG
jgi:hypothetical protein